MNKLPLLFLTLFLSFNASSAYAEHIKLAGSGQMIPLIMELGKAYMKKYPQDIVEVNQKALGQVGGVMAVNNGAIDIAMSARSLDKNEKVLQVQAYEFAVVPGLFAVNDNVPVKAVTGRQICDIYSGKIKNWKEVGGHDAPIVVLTRPESDSTKIAVRQGIACFEELKEPVDVVVLPKAKDMFNTLTATPNAIGMIDTVALSDAAGKAKALKLDGKDVSPSSQWPILHHYHLVLGKNRGEAVKRFLRFIKTPEAQAVIKKEKATPLNFTL
ncbi:MAG: phosphate transport system substrate-binding [Geobacteraceae bacterium]|nr:MAG: phosphate transport system substrate-binding [Geobacteraceae bacterium]